MRAAPRAPVGVESLRAFRRIDGSDGAAQYPRVRRLLAVLMVLGCARGAALAGAEPSLQALASSVGAGQGVYAVGGDGAVLVDQAGDRPVHPASVTKIATSLVLLARLGPTYRFTTRIEATGPIRDERLAGNVVVRGEGDPFLVDESALLVARALRARGVRVVEGRLLTSGPLVFDWQPDPGGRRLRAALAGTVGAEALAHVEGGRDVTVEFRDEPRDGDAGATLVVYRSPPLLGIVKALNGYSNNVFHLAADAIGGAAAVEASARAHVPAAMRAEVVLTNGAGAGTTNRMSPRVAVALLGALAEELARGDHDLTAALPVSGRDPGTLRDRLPDLRGVVVGKTGTFGSVGASALVGALRTSRFGMVRFAVLNHDVPVPEARARQDAFVRALVAVVGAEPWPYAPPTHAPYLDAQLD